MDKNTTIGFILIAAILIGFSFIQSNQAKKAAQIQYQIDSAARVQALEMQLLQPQDSVSEVTAQQAQSAPVYKDSLLQTAHSAQGQVITLQNDKISIDFSTLGSLAKNCRLTAETSPKQVQTKIA